MLRAEEDGRIGSRVAHGEERQRDILDPVAGDCLQPIEHLGVNRHTEFYVDPAADGSVRSEFPSDVRSCLTVVGCGSRPGPLFVR